MAKNLVGQSQADLLPVADPDAKTYGPSIQKSPLVVDGGVQTPPNTNVSLERNNNTSDLVHLVGMIIGALVDKHSVSHFYETIDKKRVLHRTRVDEIVVLAKDLLSKINDPSR